MWCWMTSCACYEKKNEVSENEVKAVIRLFSLKLPVFWGTPSIYDVSGADYSPLLAVCYTAEKVTNFKKFKFWQQNSYEVGTTI